MTSKFVWYDLNTKQLDQAKRFYGEVFGWTTQSWKPDGAPADMPGYEMIIVGDKAIGGFNVIPDDAPAPSHWMGHVIVDDVDAAMARATRMGAQFPMGAMDIPTVGRMGVMIDPQGCVCSLFQPAGDAPTLPAGDTHGMVGWNELIAADVDQAKTFYSEVVGWKWRGGPFQEQMEYWLFGSGEEGGDVGGMMPKGDMPVAAWLLYFTSKDIDETVAAVAKHGGQVIQPAFEVPTVGRLAICAGPDGSTFGVAQWASAS